MIIEQVLSLASYTFSSRSIEDSALEAEVLLRQVLGISKVELYQTLDRELNPEAEERFWALAERRLNGEPSAYILGHREFYSLDFEVNPDVLIPRPESELLVEEAIKLAKERGAISIADIGTGSGAIAISLAVNLPKAKIYAVDISAAALKMAQSNCKKHGVAKRVKLLEGDMLEPLPGRVDIIVANLPYVRESELSIVNTIEFEPELALDGGIDGLDEIRKILPGLNKKLNPGGHLLLEIGYGQSEAVTGLLNQTFPASVINVIPDLADICRVVSCRLNSH